MEEEYIHENHINQYGFWERQAMRMACWPRTHFWVAFSLSVSLSCIGMTVGNFNVSAQNGGWQSRGTLIANRQTQLMLARLFQAELFTGGSDVWDDLLSNVQDGWDNDDDSSRRLEETQRLLHEIESTSALRANLIPHPGPQLVFNRSNKQDHSISPNSNNQIKRLLDAEQQQVNSTIAGCDVDWYTDGRMTADARLWPIWKSTALPGSALNTGALLELCLAEENTQSVLEEKGLCFGCEDGGCLPPYGIVLYARLRVAGGLSLDCEGLSKKWSEYEEIAKSEWQVCVEDLEASLIDPEEGLPASCPEYFHPALLDDLFHATGEVQYTSSVFATTSDMVGDLYDAVKEFDRGGKLVKAAYDTQEQDFVNLLTEDVLGRDMSLALCSALITAIAILIHTKSPFITLVGLLQIMLSFPLAFFAYTFFGNLSFFPFLNFIGVFVVFALGADHVFVAVDKWKNARIEYPDSSTEHIAAVALPDAAGAMLLTTSTTAIAFFGTAICPVAPVKLFAIFCGLLIVFDYIMNVLLVFPCLCIYDGWIHNKSGINSCVNWQQSRNPSDNHGVSTIDVREGGEVDEVDKPSFIRRVLLTYFTFLHRFRWVLLAASGLALSLCTYYASTLTLPNTADVRILGSHIEFEQSYLWRTNLLFEALKKKGGSIAHVIWGTHPSDTGDQTNPESWSQLVLDDTFDPSTKAAQVYLRDFCPRLFTEDFAGLTEPEFECPMNRFDRWLLDQHTSSNPDEAYRENCEQASGLPLSPSVFNRCLVAWTKQEQETSILSQNGVVKIIFLPFSSRVRYDSPNAELEVEWNLIEGWMQNESNDLAPTEVSGLYFSSEDFWWYDTNTQMFNTAMGSAAIALAAAAAIILLSSRSIVMTIFSVVSVGYVLTSVTATMVAIGWTLGFLESICFSILIGVSVDFVIHFSHAYVALEGEVDRSERTKFALVHMGPSILAAAVTTFAGAVIMLFCVVTFFQKFALVLFLTIIQSTLGSFVIFLTMADCLGPSEPTYMVDTLIARCRGKPDSSDAVKQHMDTSETVNTAAHSKDKNLNLVDVDPSEGGDFVAVDPSEVSV